MKKNSFKIVEKKNPMKYLQIYITQKGGGNKQLSPFKIYK